MNTLELIQDYIQRHVDSPPDTLKLENRLDELGIDSLAMFDLLFELEDAYGIRFENNTEKPETVGQLVELIEKFRLQANNPKSGD